MAKEKLETGFKRLAFEKQKVHLVSLKNNISVPSVINLSLTKMYFINIE